MKEKLFNKGFVLITLINFVVYLVYYLLMVIIAVIAQEELNASLGEAGFASGIYIIGTLLARLYMGKKLELFGRKRVLRFGILFFLVTTMAYLYMPTIAIMFIIRFLMDSHTEQRQQLPMRLSQLIFLILETEKGLIIMASAQVSQLRLDRSSE